MFFPFFILFGDYKMVVYFLLTQDMKFNSHRFLLLILSFIKFLLYIFNAIFKKIIFVH
jgi:hypothetical protein